MLVVRRSPFTREQVSWDLPITEDQMRAFLQGVKVQDAFPHLNADQREFILTGIRPEEWDSLFPPEED